MSLRDLANFSDGLEDIPVSKKSDEVAFSSDSPYIYVYSWDFYCCHFCPS
jgi:hypothetical protein